MNLILLETVLLPLAEPAPHVRRAPSLSVEPVHKEIRLRRRLSPSGSRRRRSWWLDVAVFVPLIDPEQVLRECEGFLVDSTDDEEVGVVDALEVDRATGHVSALVVAGGWFGRRRLRIAVDDVDVISPQQERIVVRLAAGRSPGAESSL